MKRSSSIAALDDTIDVKLGNKSGYEESILVSSMMLVAIAEEGRQERLILRKQTSNGSIGSISATSSLSRCRSYGSLPGWGSTASRKSYKVDLCSLEDEDDENSGDITTHHAPSKNQRKCPTLPLQRSGASSSSTSAENSVLESWGFFLE
uniref:Uncharacterized protein n=1 Tax=Pseudo-nitzschia australis TaxID=44445 RepID=A0A7S4AX59_9STRA|mmetsp:Transcript_24972/g.54756  ORF Transcript_24972/g.54756 Transcript_24972/m.54756 type:complete len:150 (-) Transcript_24972:241-690(-)|eukprot:CAMPEP_0168192220 /NCGR_PEP_ID=MMETSP0139_2-20121125/17930_1 /TAXON_ID=44445 /ORGANISM="Pseudo-nitzschia australis, Strain 10249 10 AB" /LENGTH=149 /DNA_ID=CAMNT_0008115441 /DNA_START=197 /DNA_END=646 /DNA_ORIENTATION=-